MDTRTNKLTTASIKSESAAFLKSGKREKRIADGGGLALLLRANGNHVWQYRYRFHGRQDIYTIGPLAQVSLKKARERHREARAMLGEGVDPKAYRQQVRAESAKQAATTFEGVAREWYAEVHSQQTGRNTHTKNIRRLELYAFPIIGRRPIADVSPSEVLEVLRRLHNDKPDTAKRLRSVIGQVFRYAVSLNRAQRDVTADLRGLVKPPEAHHFPALTEPKPVGELLRAIDDFSGGPTVSGALRLAPYLFLRIGELRRCKWDYVNWEEKRLELPETKNGQPLIVPLSRQALEILRELERTNGRSPYIFPGGRAGGRPMSDMAINKALKALGYKGRHTGHGFRAMAKTMLQERLNYRVEVVEMQMAHTVRDVHGNAYNRAQWLAERETMMQAWADYLDSLKTGGKVVAINSGR